MNISHTRFLFPLAFCGCFVSSSHSQPQSQLGTPAPKLPLRTLIVSGGPTPDYNQYAIESNARYVEKLTARAASQRVLFADGSKKSRTISTLESRKYSLEERILSWVMEEELPEGRTVYRASTLKRIDGSATKKSILKNAQALASQVKPGERGLVYFTGHGSEGVDKVGAILGGRFADDLDNTLYSLWNSDDLSVKELAGGLQKWPQDVPLVLVMVQCHSGGFANLMFEGGDPQKPVLNRDFCGFFAATAERQSSGCTNEVNERDYQDFTTHFFAALSGRSRQGQAISGADYDKNGAVSMLEAYAWTNLRDGSTDVPVCTSDAYLRHIFPSKEETSWMKTPYSTLIAGASPWQKAMLNGLSQRLGLKGENRLASALTAYNSLKSNIDEDGEAPLPSSIDTKELWRRYYAIEDAVEEKFPNLEAPKNSARYLNARRGALLWLKTRSADVKFLNQAFNQWTKSQSNFEVREAMLWRFIRASRTLVLEKQLAKSGTPEQRAIFARLRTSESKNPLRP